MRCGVGFSGARIRADFIECRAECRSANSARNAVAFQALQRGRIREPFLYRPTVSGRPDSKPKRYSNGGRRSRGECRSAPESGEIRLSCQPPGSDQAVYIADSDRSAAMRCGRKSRDVS